MKQAFQYSVLKYRPSYLLDERINIGILFFYESELIYENGPEIEKRLKFVFPKSLKRVSDVFPSLANGGKNITDIKRYLRGFQEVAEELCLKEIIYDTNLEEIIPSNFIIKDANSLFFSEVKSGFYLDIDDILSYYKDLYFRSYDGSYINRQKDTIIKKQFYNSLLELTTPNDLRLKYFEESIYIDSKIDKSRFEYKWQNGTTNLIKTLSFNLVDKHSIQRKAFNWNTAFHYISKISKYNNYQFDILVDRPTNSDLFKAYDNALEVLHDSEGNKKIIENDKIKDYAVKALETVKNPKEF